MTNENDVRWLDEVALHKEVLAGDQEAFAELMRRFDPLVRAQLARLVDDGELDREVAQFWCERLQDLRAWDPEQGLFAHWLGHQLRRAA